MKPTVRELFKIHDLEKQVLVTGENPLDLWECKKCGLSIRLGFGFYNTERSCTEKRLRTCKKK